jgi:hypothetical protein
MFGFQPVRQVDLLMRARLAKGNDIVSSSRDNNPFRDVDLDLEKAREVANHFGKYPIKEVEKIRDGRLKETEKFDRMELLHRVKDVTSIFDCLIVVFVL